LRDLFIFVSVLLPLISPFVYAKAILRGEAKPHRTTRFVLLIDTLLATASLFAQHNYIAMLLSGVSALQAIVIFALCIKRGIGGWSKTDMTCLIIAFFGIYLWQTTKNPLFALYASIAADLAGMIPAILKTYWRPETEIWTFFILDAIAGIFNLFALPHWSTQETAYPLYIVLINFFMVLLIVRPGSKHFQRRR
jgi:hypothetical protein